MGNALISEEIAEVTEYAFSDTRPTGFLNSFHLPETRERWYNDYTVPEKGYYKFENSHAEKFKENEEVSALDYINWINGTSRLDCRPKFYDNVTKSYMLLDTGAMSSCVQKKEDDKINPNLTLRTADGKPMPTYSTREVTLRIGRKTYTVSAIVTDVKQTIIGMDLFNKLW